MASVAAEKLLLETESDQCSSDLDKADVIARDLVRKINDLKQLKAQNI